LNVNQLAQIARNQPKTSILSSELKLRKWMARFSEGNFYNSTCLTFLKKFRHWRNVWLMVNKTPLLANAESGEYLYLVTLVMERRFKPVLFRDVALLTESQLSSYVLEGDKMPLAVDECIPVFDHNARLIDAYLHRGRFEPYVTKSEWQVIQQNVRNYQLQRTVAALVEDIKKAPPKKPSFATLWHKDLETNWLDRCFYLEEVEMVATFQYFDKDNIWRLNKIYRDLDQPVANGKLLESNEHNHLFKYVEEMAVRKMSRQYGSGQ
jgi:hypothetical protein